MGSLSGFPPGSLIRTPDISVQPIPHLLWPDDPLRSGMPDPESLERITARRAEVDELAVAEHGCRTGLHDAFASLAGGLICFRRLKKARS